VPELQARGLFRREYKGTTLRDHFGLPPVPARRRDNSWVNFGAASDQRPGVGLSQFLGEVWVKERG
jgi:hypothetical protein